MVQSAARTSSGSSSREYSITFECAPPSAVRPGVPLTLPVIVAVRPVGSPRDSSVQQLVVNVSLRNESGTAACPGLTGTLTSSVRSRHGNTTTGFGKFNRLTIAQPGRYRLRVMLGAASASGVTTRDYIDSGVIEVHAGAPAAQRPTPSQVTKLQNLIPENIDLSAGDIAAWQQA
ncbi:hypothetical protein P875_00053146 [Aspergillus parasiticus SU-1]|uniref:Uncharacterized protein n=1 Tax=Aspergillus parasiticus (strain ATCC 56775 / NRRL 5862 / SRRC 143 / SU-1) TaxID=1403190 RepID=A0A0F0I0D3_ASPPU|nr:hypothetical protein P875_00053146 [Aspergillus parasiticus SU-1]